MGERNETAKAHPRRPVTAAMAVDVIMTMEGYVTYPSGGMMVAQEDLDAFVPYRLDGWDEPATFNIPTPGTIRTWANRGKVKKYGPGLDGKQRYDLIDIYRLCLREDH